MELDGRAVIVTGGASGIGEALAERFAAEGAERIIVCDVDAAGAGRVAERIGGEAIVADLAAPEGVAAMVDEALAGGPVDVLVSNAGLFGGMVGVDAGEEVWDALWQVNVMAHVRACRLLLPSMLERGEGYLINTASAAGLLMNLGALPYSVTKHGAVALAEWLAVSYGDRGIRVSCICPMGVWTPMLADDLAGGPGSPAVRDAISPEAVADSVVAGMRDERLLILPHEQVAEHVVVRAADHGRWIAHLRQVEAKMAPLR